MAQHQQCAQAGHQHGDPTHRRQKGEQRADDQRDGDEQTENSPVHPVLVTGEQKRAQAQDFTFTEQWIHL